MNVLPNVLVLLMLLFVYPSVTSPAPPAVERFLQWHLQTFGYPFGVNHLKYDSITQHPEFKAFNQTLARLKIMDSKGWKGHGLSRFAALTPEEFASLNGYRSPSRTKGGTAVNATHTASIELSTQLNSGTTPAAFDWRHSSEGNMQTDVKNQGNCGGCWAYASVAGVESAWAIAGHALTELSVNQVLNCDRTKHVIHTSSGDTMCADTGCSGGNPECAAHYILENGLERDSDYQGTPQANACQYSSTAVASGATGITAYTLSRQTEETMAQAVASQGPLTVGVDATTWQDYKKGVLTGCPPNPKLNHAVQIVGYGTDPVDGDYWTIRNSWGTTWGDLGYIKVSRGNNCFGITQDTAVYYKAKAVGNCEEASCAQCTASSKCGWCASTSSCMAGTSSGPSKGSCTTAKGKSWAFASSSCPVPPTPSPTPTPAPAPVFKHCDSWSWSWKWQGTSCLAGVQVAAKWALISGGLLCLSLLCCLWTCCRGRKRRQLMVVRREPPSQIVVHGVVCRQPPMQPPPSAVVHDYPAAGHTAGPWSATPPVAYRHMHPPAPPPYSVKSEGLEGRLLG